MRIEIKGKHNFNIHTDTREYIEEKEARLDFGEKVVEEITIALEKEKDSFVGSAHIHYKNGHVDHIVEKDRNDIHKVIDFLFDKLERDIRREKEKTQDHHGKRPDKH